MNKRLQTIVDKVIHAEESPAHLALSCCLGIFFACSPFLGIQTILLLGVGLLFGLNTPIALIVLFLVNNPLTMVPIIILDYVTGYFFVRYLLGYDISYAVPAFLTKIDNHIHHRLNSWFPNMQFSFAYYIIGGLIFALLCSLLAYPFLVHWFKKLKPSKRV